MRLAEALQQVEIIEVKLRYHSAALRIAPEEEIYALLEECNSLWARKHNLVKSIIDTEETIYLQGNSLAEVRAAHTIVSEKILLLANLSKREDLDSEQRAMLDQQLQQFRFNQDTLSDIIESCIWETDILDE